MDRHHRVEEVGQVDPVGFRSEFERLAGASNAHGRPAFAGKEGSLERKSICSLSCPSAFCSRPQRVLAHRIG
jgi:hypothetical protein